MRQGTTTAGVIRWLRWALDFANANPSGLRAQDWLNLQADLSRFLNSSVELEAGRFVTHPDAGTAPVTVAEVRSLQAATRALLFQATEPARAARPPLRASVGWELLPGASGVDVHAHGSTRDVFLARLVFLLLEAGPGNLRRCPATDCGRLFWKFGRRKYCSGRCTNRAVFQAWLKTPKGRTRSKREAKAARERRQYQRRLAEIRARKRRPKVRPTGR